MKTLLLAIAVLLPLAQTSPAAPRAETASIRGRITDKMSGEPIARAVVTAYPAEGRSRATGTLTDADGRYTFPMLVPGRYSIRAEHTVDHEAQIRSDGDWRTSRVGKPQTVSVANGHSHVEHCR